ncbi:hypothetical protein UFOVP71_236 [uncultured Caudovirales phage]|uniref:Uncharacterized protein n=1 Tax=uncultured Caudovirales phage TaxID=2100421 RepID=A0A6J5T9T5_9CAUD|nr:hypothetical protein UFOVP71_236 [uncultured Caudovirales phage]
MRSLKLNITLKEVIQRIEFGIARLQDENVSAAEQANILRAIGSISRKRYEEIDQQLKEEVTHG